MTRGCLKIVCSFISLAAVASVSACANYAPPQTAIDVALYCAPLDVALTSLPESLRTAAQSGEAQAQFSYAIVLANGLNGVVPNGKDAQDWRTKAVAPRGTRASSIYVPGAKHQAGSVMMISVPVYDVSFEQQIAVDDCIAALKAPADRIQLDQVAKGLCGGLENYQRLRAAWAAAIARPQP